MTTVHIDATTPGHTEFTYWLQGIGATDIVYHADYITHDPCHMQKYMRLAVIFNKDARGHIVDMDTPDCLFVARAYDKDRALVPGPNGLSQHNPALFSAHIPMAFTVVETMKLLALKAYEDRTTPKERE